MSPALRERIPDAVTALSVLPRRYLRLAKELEAPDTNCADRFVGTRFLMPSVFPDVFPADVL